MELIYFSILMCIGISCSDHEAQVEIVKQKDTNVDTLTFTNFEENFLSKLYLLSNGNYTNERYNYSCYEGQNKGKIIQGTYIKDSFYLNLFPYRIDYVDFEFDFYSADTTETIFGADSLINNTKFKIIKWGKNTYLLSSFKYQSDDMNDYKRFATNIKESEEPRSGYGYFSMRSSDSVVSKLDINQIPNDWKNLFVDSVFFSISN